MLYNLKKRESIVKTARFSALLIVAALFAGGCESKLKITPKKERLYRISHSQTAPAPTYNRLRWGHLPAPIPPQPKVNNSAPLILPVINLVVKDTPLSETAVILASAVKYSSYCSTLIGKRKITINTVGTIDEIGRELSKKAGIKVQIDHNLREVRFLSRDHAKVKGLGFSGKTGKYESGSIN